VITKEKAVADDREWNRRSLLRGAAVVTGAAAAASLLGETARAQAGGNDAAMAAQAGSGDADALFKAGKFDAAARLYEAILQKDPKNMRAARQRGLIGLLGNQFPVAEKYLTMALKLAPADNETNELLGDCYIRQDKFALSVPRWQAAGEVAYPRWFAAFSGTPYQIHGDTGQVPFLKLDPMPQVEASINGGPPKHLTFYTGAPNLSLTASAAKQAGLSPVASQKTDFEGSTIWTYYGVLDSFKLGGIELRNVPVGWSSTESGQDVDTSNDGLIGTWVFYHFLTTFDYAGQSLILRRPTPEAASKARADAARAGVKPLPCGWPLTTTCTPPAASPASPTPARRSRA
jgi:tetratricopeptide (TPR) repeat protein